MIYNAVTKSLYNAFNSDALLLAMTMQGWPSGEFAGFQQWKKAGRQVRSGEKGTAIVMYVDKTLAESETTQKVKVRKVKFVFNIAQTEVVNPLS